MGTVYPQGLRDVWCLDLGSVTTRVIVVGKKKFQQPTPTRLQLLEKGRLSDFQRTVEYLRSIREKIGLSEGWRDALPSAEVARVAVASQAFPADCDILKEVFQSAGWGRVEVFTKAEAYRQQLGLQLPAATVGIVVDCGAETTELAVIDNDHVLAATTWYQGSHQLTTAIQQYLQHTAQVQITASVADGVKQHVAGLWPPALASKLQHREELVRGISLASNEPVSIHLSGEMVHQAYMAWYDELISKLRGLMARPEIGSSLRSSSTVVWLTGGGAALLGLDTVLEVELDAPVSVSSTALQDIVQGLTKV